MPQPSSMASRPSRSSGSRWSSASGTPKMPHFSSPGASAQLRSPLATYSWANESHEARLRATWSGSSRSSSGVQAPPVIGPRSAMSASQMSGARREQDLDRPLLDGSQVHLHVPDAEVAPRIEGPGHLVHVGRQSASAAPGRPDGPWASSVSPTVTSSVAGSRASASHAATRSARRCAKRSLGKPNQAAFQASACFAVSRSTRSPLAAMRIGIRPGSRAGRGGGGMRTASSTSCHRPCTVTRSPWTSGTMIDSASSNRPARWSKG